MEIKEKKDILVWVVSQAKTESNSCVQVVYLGKLPVETSSRILGKARQGRMESHSRDVLFR